MNIERGGLYLVKDEFFSLVQDNELFQNKNEKRPHYMAAKDEETQLLWFIPCSSQIKKWEQRISSATKQGFKFSNVKIVTINRNKEVLLFHKMFPITENFVKREYTIAGTLAQLKVEKLLHEFELKIRTNIQIVHTGKKLDKFAPNILRIEQLMLKEIGWSDNKIYEYQNRLNKNKKYHLSQEQVDDQYRQTQIID